jgi:hypothetical protein
MAQERRSVAEMIGEFMRELALLILVFVPLDRLFRASGKRFWFEFGACVALSLMVLAIGVVIELRRE